MRVRPAVPASGAERFSVAAADETESDPVESVSAPGPVTAAEAGQKLLQYLDRRLSGAVPPAVRQVYLDACRAAVPSIVADYRASAGIDIERYTTVIVWCESFSQFISAAKYR